MTASPFLLGFILSVGSLAGCSGDTSHGASGESCRAHNDCQSGLACINQVCIPGSSHLSVTGKACYRVQCESNAGCCTDFVPAANCDIYDQNCRNNPSDCDAFRTLCQCNRVCSNELCVDKGPGCTVDAHCPALTSPYCMSGRCVACREPGDCAGGALCVKGTCQAACKTNENCPLLHACNAGVCVPSGCTSDRECAFALGNPLGRCANGTCSVGCSYDAQCNTTAFEVCHEGRCTFAGCQTDVECRAYLNLSNSPDNTSAVCR